MTVPQMRITTPYLVLPTVSYLLLALLAVTYSVFVYGDDILMRLPMVSVSSTSILGKNDSFNSAAVAVTKFTSQNMSASSLLFLYTNDVTRPINEWSEGTLTGQLSSGEKCTHQLTPVLYNNAIRGGSKSELHLFFICSEKVNEGGILAHSTSSDSGKTWSVPVKLAHSMNTGLLLASATLVDKGPVKGSQWYLAALDLRLNVKVIVMESNGTEFRGINDVSSAKNKAWDNSMYGYANLDDKHRSVGALLVSEDAAMKFSSVETNDFSKWDILPNDEGTFMPAKNNKDTTFISRFATASSILPISPTCKTARKNMMVVYVGAAVNDDGSTVSYGSSSTAEGLLISSKAEYRALGELRNTFKGPVFGVAAGLLPPFVSSQDSYGHLQCAYELGEKEVVRGTRAIIVKVVGDGTQPLKSSVELQVTSIFPTSNPDTKREGEPALAAAITFIIIGVVLIGLLTVFLTGLIRRKRSNNEIGEIEEKD